MALQAAGIFAMNIRFMGLTMTDATLMNGLVAVFMAGGAFQFTMFFRRLRQPIRLFPVTGRTEVRRDVGTVSHDGGAMRLVASQAVTMCHFLRVRRMAFQTLVELSVDHMTGLAVQVGVGTWMLNKFLVLGQMAGNAGRSGIFNSG